MKKANKKMILGIIMVLISTFMMMALQANAVSRDFKLEKTEYFSEDIPQEKLDQIIKIMYVKSDEIEQNTRGIFFIFGHSIATGTTKTIEHRYYSTAPKCREILCAIEYCTRGSCDYFQIKDQAVNRIVCCQ